MKFGGTSMGSPASMRTVAALSGEQAAKRPTVVVVSAMSKVTDLMLDTMHRAERGDEADRDGYAEPHLWTGIGRARSGAGAAIVGDADQVAAKLAAYRDVGVDAFILSGYPHLAECERFAELVLPRFDHRPLPWPM